MNKDRLKGKWKQLAGNVKNNWGKLTNDDIARSEGNTDKLSGAVQERYGIAKEDADEQVKAWNESLKD